MVIEYEEKHTDTVKTDKYEADVVFYIINSEDIETLHNNIMENLNVFEYVTVCKGNLYEIVSSNISGNKLVAVSKIVDKNNEDKIMVAQYNVKHGLPDLLVEMYEGR